MQKSEISTETQKNVQEIQNDLNFTSKKIYFDDKTLKRLEVMLPTYKDEFPANLSEKERFSMFLALAVQKLYENDFLDKLKTL